MKTYDINIDTKYFEPIRNGQITTLIFNRKPIDYVNGESAEILAKSGEYTVRADINKVYVKSFGDITEQEAVSAGFLNKDFLADELQRRFKMEPIDILLNSIDSYLFYIIDISPKQKIPQDNNLFYNNTTGGNYYDTI